MQKGQLSVIRFDNRNGTISWRVDGIFHGVRIRKNFKTREEAATAKAVIESKAAQATSGLRSAATALTDDQIREAESLFRRVNGKSRSLSFYVEYALTHYREPEFEKTLSQGVVEYVAFKKRELDQDQICAAQYRRIDWELGRFRKVFSRRPLAEITPANITAFLEKEGNSMKTFNNRRGVLSTFFKFAFQRGWVAENPIPKVPHHRIRVRGGMATTFSVVQARTLMEFAETYHGGIWVPYFALCLFAGIRPAVPLGEISKLKPDAICLKTHTIHISSMVSKIREPRKVTIHPNLAAWLKAYPLDRYPIVVGNFKKRREQFRDKLQLTHDVLRHTFISMFVAKYRSIGEAAIQAGNSESVIRKHYLDLKSPQEAEEFFSIVPKHANPSITPSLGDKGGS